MRMYLWGVEDQSTADVGERCWKLNGADANNHRDRVEGGAFGDSAYPAKSKTPPAVKKILLIFDDDGDGDGGTDLICYIESKFEINIM